MAHTVLIYFEPGQAAEHALIHRLRNFGEDVFRKLRDEKHWGVMDLALVDAATTQFSIENVKSSKLHRVLTWVQQEAEEQHLLIRMTVS